MNIALAIWGFTLLGFLFGYVLCAVLGDRRRIELRDPLKYEGRDLPASQAIDYIDRVKCPYTRIDQRYCTCLSCGTARGAIKET